MNFFKFQRKSTFIWEADFRPLNMPALLSVRCTQSCCSCVYKFLNYASYLNFASSYPWFTATGSPISGIQSNASVVQLLQHKMWTGKFIVLKLQVCIKNGWSPREYVFNMCQWLHVVLYWWAGNLVSCINIRTWI
jgi:hypothetical protein